MSKSQKLGSILTTASSPEDIAAVVEFTKSASSVFVLTNLPLPNVFGLFPVKMRGSDPSLWEAILNHIGRIRGKETIGFVLPGVKIPESYEILHRALGSSRMELSWAFHAKAFPECRDPELIILTTSLLPIIIQNLKEDVRFEGHVWSAWLDSWCRRTMPVHKYLDVTAELGLIDLQPKPVVLAPEIAITGFCDEVAGEVPAAEEKPVKAKRKRKKKKS